MNQPKVKREKVATASGEMLEAQIAKLRGVFPEAFVEGKLDFDKLKATLGGAAESGPGRFSFFWAGKDDAAPTCFRRPAEQHWSLARPSRSISTQRPTLSSKATTSKS